MQTYIIASLWDSKPGQRHPCIKEVELQSCPEEKCKLVFFINVSRTCQLTLQQHLYRLGFMKQVNCKSIHSNCIAFVSFKHCNDTVRIEWVTTSTSCEMNKYFCITAGAEAHQLCHVEPNLGCRNGELGRGYRIEGAVQLISAHTHKYRCSRTEQHGNELHTENSMIYMAQSSELGNQNATLRLSWKQRPFSTKEYSVCSDLF